MPAPGPIEHKPRRVIKASDKHIDAHPGSHITEISPELVKLAAERYSGYPLSLAIAKFLNNLRALRTVRPVKGLMWGGVHEEDIPDIVLRLVQQMYRGPKPIKSITIKIEVEDPSCEEYDHFQVEVLDIEKPDEEGGLRPDGGSTVEELLRELERVIETEIAEARAKLAKLMKGAVAGYVRRAPKRCGKGCRGCPHGPYPEFKEPGGSWRVISEEEYTELLVATQKWRKARRFERQLERAERLWRKAEELLNEALSILEILKGEGYGE
ncbi:MAG: hypothetical protein DRJ69_06955 [Thermoprotei archaeon]|nr:MAG: hypothetical protein DRJ69_06955 [Thermoprotei archaeon]